MPRFVTLYKVHDQINSDEMGEWFTDLAAAQDEFDASDMATMTKYTIAYPTTKQALCDVLMHRGFAAQITPLDSK